MKSPSAEVATRPKSGRESRAKSPFEQAAHEYAAAGLFVFPLRPPGLDDEGKELGKTPPEGFSWPGRSTTDPNEIDALIQEFPRANIGIDTGKSGLYVLDVDGATGQQSFEEHLPQLVESAPLTVRTPGKGGGTHLYFRTSPGLDLGSKTGFLPGLDARGNGGYVVGPPSCQHHGGAYEFVGGFDPRRILDVPRPLILAVERARARALVEDPGRIIEEGKRNSSLFRLLIDQRNARALHRDDLAELAYAFNEERCSPPLPATEIETIVDSVCKYPPRVNLSDQGIGYLLVHNNIDHLRSVIGQKNPRVYEGGVWTGNEFAVERLAKATGAAVVAKAKRDVEAAKARASVDAAEDDPETSGTESGAEGSPSESLTPADVEHQESGNLGMKAALNRLRVARRYETVSGMSAVLRMARSDKRIETTLDAFDRDPMLLNFKNGTLDLSPREPVFRDHDPRDLHTHQMGCPWKESPVPTPVFDGFFEQLTGGDPEKADFLLRWMAYSLTGDISEQKILIALGEGGEGKSTLFDLLRWMAGSYGRVASPKLLVTESNKHLTVIAELEGRRVVVASEIANGERLDEAGVKRLTDTHQKGRLLYENELEIRATYKVTLVVNHLLSVNGTDRGLWRRLLVFPFTNRVSDGRIDPKLPTKLRAEAPGILQRILREGLVGWKERGLTPPGPVREATDRYRLSTDKVLQFLKDFEAEDPVPGTWTRTSEAHAAFTEWAETNQYRPLGIRRFVEEMRRKGFLDQRERTGDGRVNVFLGLSLGAGGVIPRSEACLGADARSF